MAKARTETGGQNETVRVSFKYPLMSRDWREDDLGPYFRGDQGAAVPNELLDQLSSPLLTSEERELLSFLIFETYGKHRLALEISCSDLAVGARVAPSVIARALEGFASQGFLEVGH